MRQATIELGTRQRSWLVLAAILACTFATAAVGGWLTMPSIPGWYAGLSRPSFSPPNSLFGPVWSLLYLLMSMAAWLAWRAAPKRSESGRFASEHRRRQILLIYAVQLALNLLWSVLFFALHLPISALVDCLLLLGLTIWMAIFFRRFDRTAG
jgi:tryptophan-rich sensory protein